MKKFIIYFMVGMIMALSVIASRQPVVGQDLDTWGTILNDYLNVSHNINGSLKLGLNTSFENLNVTGQVLISSMPYLDSSSLDDWNFLNDTNALTTYNDTLKNYFNSLLNNTYYFVNSSSTIAGTVSGDINLTYGDSGGLYDDNTLNITEVVSAPGLDIRMNFTGITSFSSGVIRYRTSVINGAEPIIQLWNYNENNWEDYTYLSESIAFAQITKIIYDSPEHVQNGIVQMRLYKASTGNSVNKYYIDLITIVKGIGLPSNEEVDPYSFHENENLNNSEYNISSLNLDVGGGYDAGGISLFGSGTNKGSAFFAKDILIAGNILAIADTTVNGSILPQSDNMYSLGNSSNRFINLYLSNNLLAGNYVGIGTTSPTQKLHIEGSNPMVLIRDPANNPPIIVLDGNRTASDAGVGAIQFKWNNSRIADIGGYAGTDTTNKNNGYISLRTASGSAGVVERVRIGQDGRVGINSSSPSATLTVIGNASVTKNMTINNAMIFNYNSSCAGFKVSGGGLLLSCT